MLDYETTAKLYRECDVGLSMMVTMHPSYIPLQLMASGCLIISNHNPYTTWLLKDRENCLLASASATSICDTVMLAYNESGLRATLTNTATTTIHQHHTHWEPEMKKVFNHMRNPLSGKGS